MLPLNEMHAVAAPAPAPAAVTPSPEAKPPEPAKGKPRNAKNAPPAPTNTASAFQRTDVNAATANTPAAGAQAEPEAGMPANDELSQRAADGFLINGTANNAASSPFAMAQAFGNN